MDAPSMVQRSGDKFIVRSVVSGDQLYVNAGDQSDDDDDTIKDLVINEEDHHQRKHHRLTHPDDNDDDDDDEEDDIPSNVATSLTKSSGLWEQQQRLANDSFMNMHRILMSQLNGANLSSSATTTNTTLNFPLPLGRQEFNSSNNSNNNNNNNNNLMANKNILLTDEGNAATTSASKDGDDLPQCKIKRNYSCNSCTYFTQNPRMYLTHLRDTHGEKLFIHECKHCIYASRHYQKLVRHMKMVHGLTVDHHDGSHLSAVRKRGSSGGSHVHSAATLQMQQQQYLINQIKRLKAEAEINNNNNIPNNNNNNNNSTIDANNKVSPGSLDGVAVAPSSSTTASTTSSSCTTSSTFQQQSPIGKPNTTTTASSTSTTTTTTSSSPLSYPTKTKTIMTRTMTPTNVLSSSSSCSSHSRSWPRQDNNNCAIRSETVAGITEDASVGQAGSDYTQRLVVGQYTDASSPKLKCNTNTATTTNNTTNTTINPNATLDNDNNMHNKRYTDDLMLMMMMMCNNPNNHNNKNNSNSKNNIECIGSADENDVVGDDDDDDDDDYVECDVNNNNNNNNNANKNATDRPINKTNNNTNHHNHLLQLHHQEHQNHPHNHQRRSSNSSSSSNNCKTNNSFNNNTASDPPQMLIKCAVCDFVTISRDLMAEHVAATDHNYYYTHPDNNSCSQATSQEDRNHTNTTDHNNSQNSDNANNGPNIKTKFFRCSKCNYVTHIKARFSKHVKYHSMPMIKCNMCDFRTPYKWNLDRHMKNHGGSGPFKCAVCNFTADIKQSLTVHEMNHHEPPVGNAAALASAAGSQLPASHLQGSAAAAPHHQHQRRIRNSRVAGGASESGNDASDDQDFSDGLKFHFLEGSSMLNDHLNLKMAESLSAAAAAAAAAQKKPARPIPNLIPIQSQPTTSASPSALNLSSKSSNDSKSVSEASLSELHMDLDETSNTTTVTQSGNQFKKKHGSFFDKLKEKIGTTNSGDNLTTCVCGHAAKCLSESIIHQKTCHKWKLTQSPGGAATGPPPHMATTTTSPMTINKNSSRCQFCRQRCKSSADLVAHIQNCPEAARLSRSSAFNLTMETMDSTSEANSEKNLMLDDDDDGDRRGASSSSAAEKQRIFVWNTMPAADQSQDFDSRQADMNLFVSTQIKEEKVDVDADLDLETHFLYRSPPPSQARSSTSGDGVGGMLDMSSPSSSRIKNTSTEAGSHACLKKVFKCPHCSFWASTASRFHVHIVGHLNKKPFECSLCAYRSNWRWDITKHIRLKTIRDPGHKTAKVLMNDETGRRNYTKYNRYITLMRVTEEDGNLKLMKSGEMTPNQEANLQSPHNANISLSSSSSSHNNNKGNSSGANLALMQKLFTEGNLQGLGNGFSAASEMMAENHNMSESKFGNNADLIEGGTKTQTSYKCKRCNFKHLNRMVVVEHCKGHSRDSAGVLLEAASSNAATANNPIEITPIYNVASGNSISLSAADVLLTNNVISSMLSSAQFRPLLGGGATSTPGGGLGNTTTSSPNATTAAGGLISSSIKPTNTTTINNNNNTLHVTPHQQQQSLHSMGLSGSGQNVCIKILAKGSVHNNNSNNNGNSINSIITTPMANLVGATTTTSSSSTSVQHHHHHQLQQHHHHHHPKPTVNHNNNNNQKNDHGEMDEASSGGTSGAPVWRGSAPYRCGHCHQVSNWKHVIQRHCRLKHNGNIKIDYVPKESNKMQHQHKKNINSMQQTANLITANSNIRPIANSLLVQQLNIQSQRPMPAALPPPPTMIPVTAIPVISSQPLLTSPQQQLALFQQQQQQHQQPQQLPHAPHQVGNNSSSNNLEAEKMLEAKKRFSSIINVIDQSMPVDDAAAAASKKRQYECAYCPYVTDNKSQFGYHKSLHKAERNEALQCQYCSYTATKRHLLSQHLKIHQTTSNPDDVIVVESEHHSVFPKSAAAAANVQTVSESSYHQDDDFEEQSVQQMLVKRPPHSDDKENKLKRKHGGTTAVASTADHNHHHLCPFCPFSDSSADVVAEHRQHHLVVSGKQLPFTCQFCDFTAHVERVIKMHQKLHFGSLKNANGVEYCTKYDKLKLFVTAQRAEGRTESGDRKIYDEDELAEEEEEDAAWLQQSGGEGGQSAKGANSNFIKKASARTSKLATEGSSSKLVMNV